MITTLTKMSYTYMYDWYQCHGAVCLRLFMPLLQVKRITFKSFYSNHWLLRLVANSNYFSNRCTFVDDHLKLPEGYQRSIRGLHIHFWSFFWPNYRIWCIKKLKWSHTATWPFYRWREHNLKRHHVLLASAAPSLGCTHLSSSCTTAANTVAVFSSFQKITTFLGWNCHFCLTAKNVLSLITLSNRNAPFHWSVNWSCDPVYSVRWRVNVDSTSVTLLWYTSLWVSLKIHLMENLLNIFEREVQLFPSPFLTAILRFYTILGVMETQLVSL